MTTPEHTPAQTPEQPAPSLTDLYGPVISSYSRAEAVADGLIVDVSAETMRRCGLIYPVGLSRDVYEEHVRWTPADSAARCVEHTEQERLDDVLYMYAREVRLRKKAGAALGNELEFTVFLLPRDPAQPRDELPVRLRATVGPNDDLSPVVLIRAVSED